MSSSFVRWFLNIIKRNNLEDGEAAVDSLWGSDPQESIWKGEAEQVESDSSEDVRRVSASPEDRKAMQVEVTTGVA